jgi:hypothetical protein
MFAACIVQTLLLTTFSSSQLYIISSRQVPQILPPIHSHSFTHNTPNTHTPLHTTNNKTTAQASTMPSNQNQNQNAPPAVKKRQRQGVNTLMDQIDTHLAHTLANAELIRPDSWGTMFVDFGSDDGPTTPVISYRNRPRNMQNGNGNAEGEQVEEGMEGEWENIPQIPALRVRRRTDSGQTDAAIEAVVQERLREWARKLSEDAELERREDALVWADAQARPGAGGSCRADSPHTGGSKRLTENVEQNDRESKRRDDARARALAALSGADSSSRVDSAHASGSERHHAAPSRTAAPSLIDSAQDSRSVRTVAPTANTIQQDTRGGHPQRIPGAASFAEFTRNYNASAAGPRNDSGQQHERSGRHHAHKNPKTDEELARGLQDEELARGLQDEWNNSHAPAPAAAPKRSPPKPKPQKKHRKGGVRAFFSKMMTSGLEFFSQITKDHSKKLTLEVRAKKKTSAHKRPVMVRRPVGKGHREKRYERGERYRHGHRRRRREDD